MSKEVTIITPANERIINFSTNYLQEEWLTALPENAASLLAEGEAMLNDPNYILGGGFRDTPPLIATPNP